MSDPVRQDVGGGDNRQGDPVQTRQSSLRGAPDFGPKAPQGGGMPVSAWLAAGAVVLAALAALVIIGRGKTTQVTGIQPLSPYAASLPLSGLQMSESTSLSGGKSTFIDGQIDNNGGQTVTGATMQVLFRNDEGMPPQVETVPLMLIRTREPYVDTQTVGSSPLKPGDHREFRLIFESIPTNWNQQMPEVRVIRVDTK